MARKKNKQAPFHCDHCGHRLEKIPAGWCCWECHGPLYGLAGMADRFERATGKRLSRENKYLNHELMIMYQVIERKE